MFINIMLKKLLYLYNDGHNPFPNTHNGGLGYHLPQFKRKRMRGRALHVYKNEDGEFEIIDDGNNADTNVYSNEEGLPENFVDKEETKEKGDVVIEAIDRRLSENKKDREYEKTNKKIESLFSEIDAVLEKNKNDEEEEEEEEAVPLDEQAVPLDEQAVPLNKKTIELGNDIIKNLKKYSPDTPKSYQGKHFEKQCTTDGKKDGKLVPLLQVISNDGSNIISTDSLKSEKYKPLSVMISLNGNEEPLANACVVDAFNNTCIFELKNYSSKYITDEEDKRTIQLSKIVGNSSFDILYKIVNGEWKIGQISSRKDGTYKDINYIEKQITSDGKPLVIKKGSLDYKVVIKRTPESITTYNVLKDYDLFPNPKKIDNRMTLYDIGDGQTYYKYNKDLLPKKYLKNKTKLLIPRDKLLFDNDMKK